MEMGIVVAYRLPLDDESDSGAFHGVTYTEDLTAGLN